MSPATVVEVLAGGRPPVPLVPHHLAALSLLLLGASALAQEAPRGRELTRRRVTLSRSTADTPVELHVAPDYLTTLEFDAPVERAGVKLGDRGGHFALFEVGTRLVTLKPARDLPPGERVMLTVPFADDRVPAAAVFALVLRPSEVDMHVQVVRLPRTAEAVQAELDEVRAACASTEAELEALRARSTVNGPAGMILAGLLDSSGIEIIQTTLDAKGGDGLSVQVVTCYQGPGWAVLSLEVENTGSAPWTPAKARLVLANGGRARVLPVRMKEARIEPGATARVVMELEKSGSPPKAIQLELRDSAGTRRILIPSLMF
ncbi:DUF2381 family protein [Corallococcus sp. CA054B]|uniref:DUF2381 family protein n=1 Tax=Corallococcus sp. CA054B TaxID=2316734 RepID=UPI00131535D8|nr:DUF2381 family protein [Corallococcus sp. CA054B]